MQAKKDDRGKYKNNSGTVQLYHHHERQYYS